MAQSLSLAEKNEIAVILALKKLAEVWALLHQEIMRNILNIRILREGKKFQFRRTPWP
jgi:hypothetical protein